MRALILLILVLLAAGAPLLWNQPTYAQPVVTPITDPTTTPIGPGGPSGDCVWGNTGPAAWAVSNLIQPPETYAVSLPDLPNCEVCLTGDFGSGMWFTTVHMVLEAFEACDLVLALEVLDERQILQCVSSQFLVSLPSSGLFDVQLPVDCDQFNPYGLYPLCGGFWGCENPKNYWVGIEILEATCATGNLPALVTDGSPTPQVSWYHPGDWTTVLYHWPPLWGGDLLYIYGPSWPGNLLIYADAACCESGAPITVERQSWGAVKSLYRD